MCLPTVGMQPSLHVHAYICRGIIILKNVFCRYVFCLEMKQNVSVPACEMENEGLEVTAKRAGARYVYRVEQCWAHV